MLVLGIKPTDGFWVGNDVHITVQGITRNSVRIGIEAPKDLAIVRDEILERKKHEAGK